jgi:hypothetical protein
LSRRSAAKTVFHKESTHNRPLCIGCGKHPTDLSEYIDSEDGQHPDDYVRREEGTYNHENGHFLCTDCYTRFGMPWSATGWVAP